MYFVCGRGEILGAVICAICQHQVDFLDRAGLPPLRVPGRTSRPAPALSIHCGHCAGECDLRLLNGWRRLGAIIPRHSRPVASDLYLGCATPALRSCFGHQYHQATAGLDHQREWKPPSPVEVFHIRGRAARGLQQSGQPRSSLSAPSERARQ